MVTKQKKEEEKKSIKEGLTSKATRTNPSKKAAKGSVWGGFISSTIITLIVMWVLFPFYSWQLQVIFDQAGCIDGDTKTACPLPYNKNAKPYCPNISPNGCKETMDGPDMFTKMIEFFTHTLKQIYEIITGTVWIEIDKKVTAMEKHIKNSGKKSASKGAKKGKQSASKSQVDMSGGGLHAAARRGRIFDETHNNTYGAAVDIAESVLESSLGYDSKSVKNFKCCDRLKKFEKDTTQEQCKPSFNLFDVEPFKSILPKDFGWPYTYLFNSPKVNEDGIPIQKQGGVTNMNNTRYDPNGDATESAPQRWVGAWFAKTQQRSWSASRSIWSKIILLFYPFLHDELDSLEVQIRIEKFVNALKTKMDALQKEREVANLPTVIPGMGPVGGPGVISRSNTTGGTEKTGLPVANAVGPVDVRPSAPPIDMNGGGWMSSNRAAVACGNKGEKSCDNELGFIRKNFEKIFEEYKGKFKTGNDGKRHDKGDKALTGLFEIMSNENGNWIDADGSVISGSLFEIGYKQTMANSGSDTWKLGKKANEYQASGDINKRDIDNVYLDFYVAATKPPTHSRQKTGGDVRNSASASKKRGVQAHGHVHNIGSFLNPLGGDTRYWMRYLVTWYIPILTMILMTIATFTGFWFTAFSSVNRYSNFILPFFGGIFLAFTNMFAQPASVLLYMLFGANGAHRDSKNCPYDNGVYRMRENMKRYRGLNIYITLAVIITQLGMALLSSGNSAWYSYVLAWIFPGYTLFCLVAKLIHWLWYLG